MSTEAQATVQKALFICVTLTFAGLSGYVIPEFTTLNPVEAGAAAVFGITFAMLVDIRYELKN